MVDLEIDPRLKNIDNEVAELVFEEFKKNIDLVGIHLRDARNLLIGVEELPDSRLLAKAAILLAVAALESNLAYLSGVALRIAAKQPGVLAPPQIRYLKGVGEVINENGQVTETTIRQPLGERLRLVPTLLARVIGREYELRTQSSAFRKLQRAIERRDAIVHPRWDKYVTELGWWEAAEAIDAVELYLESVSQVLHPYLIGYFSVLYTIPGNDHHEVAVGYRTFGKKGPKRTISTMAEVGILKVLTGEWFDSLMMIKLALGHASEGDSEGSMLTRVALVHLYAMLDAQLSVVSQWRMREEPHAFLEAEVLFLNEFAVGLDHGGEVWISDDFQSFKKRIKAIPAILARRVDGAEISVDLGKKWGKDLLEGQVLRNGVMHSAFGERLPRVSKEELIRSAHSVFSYSEELVSKLPTTFLYMSKLLDSRERLLDQS